MRDDFDLDSILKEFGDETAENSQKQQEPVREEEAPRRQRTERRAEPEQDSGAFESEAASPRWEHQPRAEESSVREPKPRQEERPRRVSRNVEEPVYTQQEDRQRHDLTRRIAMALLSFVLAILALVLLGWSVKNLHPASGGVNKPNVKQSVDAAAILEGRQETVPESTPMAQPLEGEEPGEGEEEPAATIKPVRKHYTIPEGTLTAPMPKAEGFHTVSLDHLEELDAVIEQAREDGLLREDELMIFNTGLDFYWDSTVQYYYDETILTICWKEVISGNTCSLVETRVADASQFRRKLAGDAFGSPNQFYATELSKNANAVVAMNADYYLFRDFGIVVYDRDLYRFNTSTYTGSYKKYNCVETCFVNGEGDFLFNYLGQETTEGELRQFIADNDILFSISFGPVLVDEWETRTCSWYPVGEIDKGYSRAGIGQVDKLHYLYMSVNHEGVEARWTVNTFAQHFGEKGVRNAYCLDGGQTGEIVFQGRPFNHIDFGSERLVSDIIYFATALPEEVSP